jgi:hypothetical protein
MKKASVLAIAAVALLSADSAMADLGLPSTPTLPPVPTVTAPKILDPVLSATPSAPQLPSVPQLPDVSVPQLPGVPTVPNVTGGGSILPSVPASPPSTSTGGGTSGGGSTPSQGTSSAGSGTTSGGGSGGSSGSGASTGSGAAGASGGSGGSGSSAGTGGGAVLTPAARRRATAQRVRRDRLLRKTVQRLQGCLGSLSGLERRTLVLRTGIGPGGPRTRAQVARRLDVSARRVTRLEHRAIRALRSRAANGRCGAGSAQTIAGAPAEGTGVAGLAQMLEDRFGSGPSAGRIEVKAEQLAAGGVQPTDGSSANKQRATVMPLPRVLGTDLGWPLVIFASAGLVALAARTLRRRDASSV